MTFPSRPASAYPSAMFDGDGGDPPVITLTLYTDAFVIRGTLVTRQRRVTRHPEHRRGSVPRARRRDDRTSSGRAARRSGPSSPRSTSHAVLFAVADTKLDTPPELRTPKVAEQALISVPPFKVTGSIYLMPGHDLREALAELTGKFVPVTSAAYWSDVLGEARQTAELVAVNHDRAQILAPHVIVDPWADLGAPGPTTAPLAADAPAGRVRRPAWPATDVPPEPRPPTEPTGW